MRRRSFLGGLAAVWVAGGRFPLRSWWAFDEVSADSGRAAATSGRRLADAARAQVGVTVGYDPGWTHLSYPGGDVPRSTGVCADVVIRAARDGLGLDLQKLVHEDMVKHFAVYPARLAWGSRGPDANIDIRRAPE